MSKNNELLLGGGLVILFFIYYFNLLNDGMMISGAITIIATLYISLIWQEKVYDERDEYIRAKVDRYLYIITLILLMADIIYKTFNHEDYMVTLIILCSLSICKIVLSRVIKNKN